MNVLFASQKTIFVYQVSANLPNGFHGYHTTDFYEINPHFGTAQDLKLLSHELHKRGMYLMLDVIANHVALPINAKFKPQDNTFGMFNEESDFHKKMPCKDWEDQDEIETCWLALGEEDAQVILPDLNT